MSGLEAEVELRLGPLHLDVAVSAAPGEVVAVLGPNGAGKTTLLRALAGLVPLERGRVSFAGRVVEDTARRLRVPAEERRAGVVFQDGRLFPHLDALANVAFGLLARGVPARDARRRAEAELAAVGLAGRGASRPGSLSGGEAQRVALARALAGEPDVVLLDEPMAALDAGTRGEVRRLLRRRLRDAGRASLLVTHDPLDALAVADRLVVVEQGRVVQAGAHADVAARPRSRYVADLVGTNLLRGRAGTGGIELEGGGLLAVADRLDAGEVFATVHPRAVVVSRSRPDGSARNVWRGRPAGLDHEGDRVRVRIEGTPSLVAEVTPASVAALDLATAEEVWVSVKATEVDVYPA